MDVHRQELSRHSKVGSSLKTGNKIDECKSVLVSAPARNKSATRPPLPPPVCGEEWKENRQKLVGRDKGSLTEQQTEGTVTTTIQIRRKHDKKPTPALSDRTGAARSRAESESPPRLPPVPLPGVR